MKKANTMKERNKRENGAVVAARSASRTRLKCFDREERTFSALTLRETYVRMQQGSTAQLQPLNE